MVEYKDIEGMPDWPFDLDNADHQVWMKDFLWRVVEELAESYEAFQENHKLHTVEELSDTLHFATELLILADVEPPSWELDKYFIDWSDGVVDTVNEQYFHATYLAGLVGNTLRNKKWKQTQMPTDGEKFATLLRGMYVAVIDCFFQNDCTIKDVYELYFKKSEVNKFRQRTKY